MTIRKNKSIYIKAVSMFFVMAILAVLCVSPVFAAVTKQYECLESAKTIKVTTSAKGSPYIVFNGEGGTTRNAGYGVGNPAPKMSLKVYNQKTGETYYKRLTGIGLYISSKLTLDKSTSYIITVSYLYDKSVNWGKLVRVGGSTYGWYNGTWYVNSTNALASFSIK